MRARKQNINNVTITDATYWMAERIKSTNELSMKYKNDTDIQIRHKKQECPVCYYNPDRIGGAAITTGVCGLCEAEKIFANTCVDVLCLDCAKKHNLCHHCGGDIDCKARRKQRFTPKPTPTQTKD